MAAHRYRRNLILAILAMALAVVAVVEWRTLSRSPAPVASPAIPPISSPTIAPPSPAATTTTRERGPMPKERLAPERLTVRPKEVLTVERLTVAPREYHPPEPEPTGYWWLIVVKFRIRPEETAAPKSLERLPALRGTDRPRGGDETTANRPDAVPSFVEEKRPAP